MLGCILGSPLRTEIMMSCMSHKGGKSFYMSRLFLCSKRGGRMLGCMSMTYFKESDVSQAMCPIDNGKAYYTL